MCLCLVCILSLSNFLVFFRPTYLSEYFDSAFPGLTISDPILTLVRLMASKNPSSLIKALLFSNNVGKLDM
jgi:hypothetical protein